MGPIRLLFVLIVGALAWNPVLADQAEDEQAIRTVQERWDDAWNRNDVHALAALVAEDVRFVNVAGQVLTGRTEFEQLQTRTHAMQFKESVRTVTATDIKFLTPDIAVAHVHWGMKGDKDADGTPRQPRNGVMMQVLMKQDAKWMVVAAQNTNVRM
jgi:uncharacterized protein (TIGR02246 family)